MGDKSLAGVKVVFLDLDGTIYLGSQLIPGALDFLTRCSDNGVRVFFLSNNSSRSVADYVEKLRDFGIPCTEEDILMIDDSSILSIPHIDRDSSKVLITPQSEEAANNQ